MDTVVKVTDGTQCRRHINHHPARIHEHGKLANASFIITEQADSVTNAPVEVEIDTGLDPFSKVICHLKSKDGGQDFTR